MIRKFFCLIVTLGFITTASAYAETYKIDLDHTTVSFKIRHLFSKVQGSFRKFDGTINHEPGKSETWNASGTIDTASIDTNVKERDTHLKSPDFFDVEKYPTIDFKTTGVSESTETTAKVQGLLTIHGVEKPVTLDVTINGIGKDPWGGTRASFSAKTVINRKDFGLNWNVALETGGVLVGDEVEIDLEIEALLKKGE